MRLPADGHHVQGESAGQLSRKHHVLELAGPFSTRFDQHHVGAGRTAHKAGDLFFIQAVNVNLVDRQQLIPNLDLQDSKSVGIFSARILEMR